MLYICDDYVTYCSVTSYVAICVAYISKSSNVYHLAVCINSSLYVTAWI